MTVSKRDPGLKAEHAYLGELARRANELLGIELVASMPGARSRSAAMSRAAATPPALHFLSEGRWCSKQEAERWARGQTLTSRLKAASTSSGKPGTSSRSSTDE